jgi:ADP-heptose:LPS heptosyltransferase
MFTNSLEILQLSLTKADFYSRGISILPVQIQRLLMLAFFRIVAKLGPASHPATGDVRLSAANPLKFLIIRFSSIGDVLQFLSVAGALRRQFPDCEIHWLTRKGFESFGANHPAIHRVWTVDPKAGVSGLRKTIQVLKQQGYTHIYDGHNNIRSRLVCAALNGWFGWRAWTLRHRFLRRTKYRWKRLLLFKFRINLYPKPFVGQWSLLEPLKLWGVSLELPPPPQLFLENSAEMTAQQALKEFGGHGDWIALAPSASYQLKRWPVGHWCELVRSGREFRFALLGGPEDSFIEEIRQSAPDRCLNLAGKLPLAASAAIVPQTRALVSNDTGMMHVAEQLGHPCIALLGPAPYGYPGRSTTLIKERDLKCRPCSKHGEGPCVNPRFQACLSDITPAEVLTDLRKVLDMRSTRQP